MIERLKRLFGKGDARTVLLKKNIAGSIVLRGLSIVVSFVLVPLTIDFVNPVQYGIWLTLSSLMIWFNFFDIGLAMGLRNRFAEAKARGETLLARQYVSTAYAAMAVVAAVLLIAGVSLSYWIDWASVLGINRSYDAELRQTMAVLVIFLALSFVASVMTNLLLGDQRPALSSLIGVAGQLVILIVVWLLVITVDHGSIITLGVILSGTPPVVLLLASFVLFATRYRNYRPSLRLVRLGLVRNLLGIGVKFFLITTSMLFIFQLMNVIISREIGPATVTEYNVAFRYFNSAFMIMMLIFNPFWAASTDAYTRGEFVWIRNKVHSLERMFFLLIVPGLGLMLGISQWFYGIWLHGEVSVSWTVSIALAVYIAIMSASNIYMMIINGMGVVRLQLFIYLGFAVIAYPVMTVLCRHFGIPGLLALPSIIYLVQALTMKIQINRLLSGTAKGIWKK